MLILTHGTLRNPGILKVRQLPRKFFGRVTPRLRGGARRACLRIWAEFQILRYLITLLPLVLIGMTWTSAALPLAQAPLLMLILIWWVEMRVLRVPAKRRGTLIDAAEAERMLDLLRVQARAALTRIGAARQMRAGVLHLVVEQSDLRGLPPLTYVTVQTEEGPAVLDLDQAEQAILRDTLFRPPLTERLLHRVNLSQNVFLRDITLDARQVSAHARLAAALARG